MDEGVRLGHVGVGFEQKVEIVGYFVIETSDQLKTLHRNCGNQHFGRPWPAGRVFEGMARVEGQSGPSDRRRSSLGSLGSSTPDHGPENGQNGRKNPRILT